MFGWPKNSYGHDHSGPKILNSVPGMTDPLIFWAPSIAPFGNDVLHWRPFSGVENNLFVGAMLGGTAQEFPHLERLAFNKDWDETARQSLLTDMKQRIHDVRQGRIVWCTS